MNNIYQTPLDCYYVDVLLSSLLFDLYFSCQYSHDFIVLYFLFKYICLISIGIYLLSFFLYIIYIYIWSKACYSYFYFCYEVFGSQEGYSSLNGAILRRANWIWAHMEPSRPISAPISQFRGVRRCQGVPEPIFWDTLERNHRSGILHRIHYFPPDPLLSTGSSGSTGNDVRSCGSDPA